VEASAVRRSPESRVQVTPSATFATSPGVTLSPARFPKPEDFYFAPTKEHLPVYQSLFEVVIPANVGTGAKSIDATLSYQACDDRLCYAPQTLPVSFDLSAGSR